MYFSKRKWQTNAVKTIYTHWIAIRSTKSTKEAWAKHTHTHKKNEKKKIKAYTRLVEWRVQREKRLLHGQQNVQTHWKKLSTNRISVVECDEHALIFPCVQFICFILKKRTYFAYCTKCRTKIFECVYLNEKRYRKKKQRRKKFKN